MSKRDLPNYPGVYSRWVLYGGGGQKTLAVAQSEEIFDWYEKNNKNGDDHEIIGKFLGYSCQRMVYDEKVILIEYFIESEGQRYSLMDWICTIDDFDWKPLLELYDRMKPVIEDELDIQLKLTCTPTWL